MKLLKFIILPCVLIVAIGYGVYHYGLKIASDKVMNSVSTQLIKSGEAQKIQQTIKNDPQLKSFIKAGGSIDQTNLPIKTKEQAIQVVINKVGISKLNQLRTGLQNGTITENEALKEIKGKLTKEEMLSLEAIAYKELGNK